MFSRELRDIPRGAAAGLAAEVLPGAPSLTTAQIRSRLRRLVLAFDPEAAGQRKADAARDTEVVLWPESSGNAALVKPGAARGRGTGRGPAADRAGPLAIGSRRGGQHQPAPLRRVPDPAARRRDPARCSRPAPRHREDPGAGPRPLAPPAVTGTIHLTMPLSTWAGLSRHHAGEVAGYGPVDAATCRDLAALMTQATATRWQVSLVTPVGQAIAAASAQRLGHRRRRGTSRDPVGRGGRQQARLAADQPLRPCRAEDGYRPSRRLRDLVIFRQPECSFPGCRRPGARCDLDHTTPYDQGGLTCECNLAALVPPAPSRQTSPRLAVNATTAR